MEFINLPALLSSKQAIQRLPFLKQLLLTPQIEQRSFQLKNEFIRIIQSNAANNLDYELAALVLRMAQAFKSFTVTDLRGVVEHASIYEYMPGEHIYKEGTNVDRLYFLLSGSCVSRKNLMSEMVDLFAPSSNLQEQTTFSSGTFVGTAIQQGQPYQTTWATATMPTYVLSFPFMYIPNSITRNFLTLTANTRRRKFQTKLDRDISNSRPTSVLPNTPLHSRPTTSDQTQPYRHEVKTPIPQLPETTMTSSTTTSEDIESSSLLHHHSSPLQPSQASQAQTIQLRSNRSTTPSATQISQSVRVAALSPIAKIRKNKQKNNERKKILEINRPTSPIVEGWDHFQESDLMQSKFIPMPTAKKTSTPTATKSRSGKTKKKHSTKNILQQPEQVVLETTIDDTSLPVILNVNQVLGFARRLIRSVAFLDANHLSLWNLGFRQKCATRWKSLQDMMENVCETEDNYIAMTQTVQSYAQDAGKYF